jgi:hypothetical protein
MGDKLDPRKAGRSRKSNSAVSLDQVNFANTNSSIGHAADGNLYLSINVSIYLSINLSFSN